MRRTALLLAIVVLLGGCRTSSAPVSSPSIEQGTAAPTASGAAGTPEPTVAPTAVESRPVGPVDPWDVAATFDTSPGASYVTEVAVWSGRFIAIGSSWASEYQLEGEKPAMWTSGDGRAWEAQPLNLGVESVTLVGVAQRADGRLLLLGAEAVWEDTPKSVGPRSVAWVSSDGIQWEMLELPLADSARVDSLAHGPKGYVLGASTPYSEFDPNTDTTPGELWFSPDAIAWTKTYEGASGVVAGDEGFVAIQSALAAGPSAVVASADGQTWYPSGLIGPPMLDIAPLGGDWLATAYSQDTIQVLHSPDGLTWTPVLDVNHLTGPDGPKTGRGLNEPAINGAFLAGGAGYGFLMLGDNHCCGQPWWTYGVWATTNGVTWTEAIPGNAFVSSVAADGVIVLGGHLGRGEDATFWVAD